MPVFKPRNRLVNFRLSEEEFEKLRASCSLSGARSLSDFARAAVMRSVVSGSPAVETAEAAPEPKLNNIDRKVNDLENRVGELLRLMDAVRLSQHTASERGVADSAVAGELK